MVTEDKMTLSIKWSTPEYDGGTSVIDYRLEMKAEDLPWLEIAVNLSQVVFIDPELNAGKQYIYRVQARNSIGYGPFSEDLVILAGAPPSSPSKPLIRLTDRSLDIDWSRPSYDGGGTLSV